MKAVVYKERAKIEVVDIPKPELLKDDDVIVRITLAGVCGADLEFTQNGPEMGLFEGMRIGHEFVGIVDQVGKDIHSLKVGDRVIASAMFVDGDCYYCKRDLPSACDHGGLFGTPLFAQHGGDDIQGGQAEFIRVPYGNSSLFKLPEGLIGDEHDTKVLPLGDNFATGYHGALNANIKTGETVVVIGDGAVGLSAVMAATLFGPSTIILVGRHDSRLALAKTIGATHVVNSKNEDPVVFVKSLTDGRGANSVIDSVGNKTAISQGMEMTQAGASISVLGFGHLYEPVDQPYSSALFRNITIHTGVVNVAAYMKKLLPIVERGVIDPSKIFTDILPLSEAEKGYDLMRDRSSGTLKVALRP